MLLNFSSSWWNSLGHHNKGFPTEWVSPHYQSCMPIGFSICQDQWHYWIQRWISNSWENRVASEQGETSTILTFINACGDVAPPMVIHKAARVQDSWKVKAPGDVTVSATSKGYITKSRFHEYGLRFIHYLKSKGVAYRPNLLIIDGHKSHVYNLPAMHDNNIEILTIPPHTLHLLQVPDSVPFAQFKKWWEYHLMRYNNAHSGCSLTKPEFWEVFSPAWNSAMVPKNIISGFREDWNLST